MRKILAIAAVAISSMWALPAAAVPIFANANYANAGDVVTVQQNLQNGNTVYTDRTYTFKDVGTLAGFEWLQTANDAKNNGNTLNFDVQVNARLFLWIDNRVNVAGTMAWVANDGWAATVLSAILTDENGTEQSYSVYTRDVSALTNVTTGAQSGGSFYGLAGVQFARKVSVPEPGTLALIGFGLMGLGVARRRRKTA